MKTQLIRLLTALALCASLHRAVAQGTAFTYQGRLNNNTNPANGVYDFIFTVFNANSGGSIIGGISTRPGVGVTNGLFTVTVDCGSGIFTSQSCWLQITVETNGVGPFVSLSPRQQLTPTPYAIFAENSGGVNNSSISAPQLNTVGAPASGQVLEFNGASLVWTNPASGGSGWSLTGNAGTTPGTDFLGTTDNEPLELWVNGARAFRLEPGNGNPNVIGGTANSVDPFVGGATIAGGVVNTVSASSSSATISGGAYNTVSNQFATVSGGTANHAIASDTVVGGGYNNTASGLGATVSGGVQNYASGIGAFIGGGGYDGTTQAGNSAGGPASVVGGGLQNGAFGAYDTVPGGSYNIASGGNSFAAGHQAQALHNGAFVWADATGGAFLSTAPDQFSVRALGGVRFVTGGAGLTGMTLDGYQVLTTASGGGGVGAFTNGWSLSGNAHTDPSVNYLGTSDGAGLELRVNALRGLRLDYVATGAIGTFRDSINVNGGYWGNALGSGTFFQNTVLGGTIAGGGYETLFTSHPNFVTGDFGTVGGGYNNDAGYGATVPGGYNNNATGDGSFAAGRSAQTTYDGSFIWGDGTQVASATGPNRFEVLATGGVNFYPGGANVSIASPSALVFGSSTRQMLNLWSTTYGIGVQSSTLYQRVATGGGFAWYAGGVHNNAQNNSGGGATLMTLDGSGNLNVAANASVCTLTIRGGCDLAEPFEMSTPAIVQGSVVVIDDQHAGQLKLSDRAYDTRVAGIVSGANGINPGIALHQEGAFQDGQNVALSGRVYVLADASSSPITPGDLLTTSQTPGHAMKVSDHARAQGAILGKAMTGLKDGKGMVLVLVTLQ
jgi:hypothetical protein